MSHDEHVDELRIMSAAFDDVGLDWCLIKWPDDDRKHDDIDVLVSDVNRAVALAAENGYRYDPDPDPYRRKMVKGVVELDIHTAPAWVGIEYLDTNYVLNSIRRRERSGIEVPVPSPEADLLIWAAHDLRSNAVPKHDVDYCRELIREANLSACRGVASMNGWLAQFNEFVHIVHTYRDAPDEMFPVRLSLLDSTVVKGRVVLSMGRRKGLRTGIRSAAAIIRFDVPYVIRRILS